MNETQLNILFQGVNFSIVASVMFSIGAVVLLIHGAWKAYKFVRSAVVGSTAPHEASSALFAERFSDYTPSDGSDFDGWSDDDYKHYYGVQSDDKE